MSTNERPLTAAVAQLTEQKHRASVVTARATRVGRASHWGKARVVSFTKRYQHQLSAVCTMLKTGLTESTA